MAIITQQAIFLGNFALADSDEVAVGVETQSIYEQNFGSAANPLSGSVIDVDYDDADDNDIIALDNSGPPGTSNMYGAAENITYTALGAGSPSTSTVDSLVVASGTITHSDGTSRAFSDAVMIQAENGDLLLLNSTFDGENLNTSAGGDSLSIESINVTDVQDGPEVFGGPTFFFQGLLTDPLTDFVCFARGTRIRTNTGDVAIESLTAGSKVLTKGGGFKEIGWIGSSKIDGEALKARSHLKPIRIKAGALGEKYPEQDLLVSPQHRVLVSSTIAERMFGAREVLIPAKKLTPLVGVEVAMDLDEVDYFHLLFEAHEIVMSNGMWSESLFTGQEALKRLPADCVDEITELFPEILYLDKRPKPARLIPEKGKLIKQLVMRHVKNKKPLYSVGHF